MKLRRRIKDVLLQRIRWVEQVANSREFDKVNVFKSIDENMIFLKKVLESSQDVVYRSFTIGETKRQGLLVYVKGMVDHQLINHQVLQPIMGVREYDTIDEKHILDEIKNEVLSVSDISTANKFDEILLYLLKGNTLLFLDNVAEALIISSFGGEARSVEEPTSEQTIRGPRDGFVESLNDNISLIRRRICDPNLAVEFYTVGTRTQTEIALVYLKDVINESIVLEIKDRLAGLKTDEILASAELEQLIEKHKWSLFPQVLATERPDKVAASILEGRAVIMVNGTPFILIAPATFAMFFNSPDDYFERSVVTSLIRLTRYFSYFVATSLPALYIALTAYHPGMIPTSLALYITGSRVGIPFPILVEMIFMEFTLLVLLEAAVRLPKPIGPTIGIVGGLVIGQAVVQAGLVSPVVIIVVALTAITSFVIPNYTFALTSRVLRIILIVGAAVWGLYGVMAVLLAFLIHLASIESFGVRYLEDFSPFRAKNLRDTILKAPKGFMGERPIALETKDEVRQITREQTEE